MGSKHHRESLRLPSQCTMSPQGIFCPSLGSTAERGQYFRLDTLTVLRYKRNARTVRTSMVQRTSIGCQREAC